MDHDALHVRGQKQYHANGENHYRQNLRFSSSLAKKFSGQEQTLKTCSITDVAGNIGKVGF